MKKQQGFTLIELAIVLVIVTILVGGLAMPLSAQIQARRVSETKKIMEEAREAIFGYAMSNLVDHDGNTGTPLRPTLPCPDTDGDGRENRTGTACTVNPGFNGLLPWVDLGVAGQDAWGNRLHYAITVAYGDRGASNTFMNDPSPNPSGDKQICDTSVGVCNLGNIATAVPVVVVSYGPNGWGAINVSGSTLQAPTSDDERENISSIPGLEVNAYVTHPPTQPPNEFDDLVVWIPHPLLISRVCPNPGGCP